ncbi:MAG: CDP-alcohol phosphatidyltransferase family protein [Nakamurella sp.]
MTQPPARPDDAGRPAQEPPARPAPVASSRILTIPNLLSFIRLLGVPLFLYLLLGPQLDGWALAVLIVSAITDYADGKLARLLDQYSRLGELLDPAADRLYIVAALVGFVIRGFIPWWVAVLIIGRDVLLACTLPILRRYGYTALPVHYLGKAATFCLLYGLPMLLLAQGDSIVAQIALPTSYAFIAWGLVMYLVAGGIYFQQLGWVIRNCPLAPRFRPPTVPTDPSGVSGG